MPAAGVSDGAKRSSGSSYAIWFETNERMREAAARAMGASYVYNGEMLTAEKMMLRSLRAMDSRSEAQEF